MRMHIKYEVWSMNSMICNFWTNKSLAHICTCKFAISKHHRSFLQISIITLKTNPRNGNCQSNISCSHTVTIVSVHLHFFFDQRDCSDSIPKYSKSILIWMWTYWIFEQFPYLTWIWILNFYSKFEEYELALSIWQAIDFWPRIVTTYTKPIFDPFRNNELFLEHFRFYWIMVNVLLVSIQEWIPTTLNFVHVESTFRISYICLSIRLPKTSALYWFAYHSIY